MRLNMLFKITLHLYIIACHFVCVDASASSFNAHKHNHKPHHSGLKGFEDENADKDPDNQLRNENFVRNADHLKEHLKDVVNFDVHTAAPEELDFHFFKLHDTSEDHRLDGLELLSAIAHGMEEMYDNVANMDIEEKRKTQKLNGLNNKAWLAVDRILRDDDKNNDGYITYDEFALSRRASKVLRDILV